MVDLHRHDECSTFDGFGKATELAKLAKELGHSSFSTTNHGNTNGLVKHYKACQKEEIKCIMGVEGYFQPKLYEAEERASKPRYHICIFAKNAKGYENMNELMYQGEKQKYYNPIFTFNDLKKFREGIICSSACIQGILSQAILKDNIKVAEKALLTFVEIFEDDFYIEIQPYKVDEEETQEKINIELMRLAFKHNVKMILTSDSHYGKKEDFDSYLKMHEIAKHNYDIEQTYGERYMPTKKELMNRMLTLHGQDLWDLGVVPRDGIKQMMKNLDELEDKIEQDIFEQLEEELPSMQENAYEEVVKLTKQGLERIGKHKDKEYIDRVKQELKIIKMHDFSDYFLIVQDYVQFCVKNQIPVGPGRGSVCNCEVAYLLGITKVDSIRFGLDFRRFLREDKKKLPDIDLDFATNRRQEVIDYLVAKYRGHAAQICSYGLYKVDNLINDLAKVCGMDDKEEKITLKKYLEKNIDDTYHFHYNERSQEVSYYNKLYDNIVKHFDKLYNKLRFIGTHAAGVAITGANIRKYCGIKIVKDKETGVQREFTSYDLADLDVIHVVKFDMLGLKTMESLGELRMMTGKDANEMMPDSAFTDAKVYEQFAAGETDGIFQYETSAPRKVLQNCSADCFEDIIAVSSMNRPGPLSMKMPEQYARNKFDLGNVAKTTPYYEYVKDTYGVVVYQEQLQAIATEIGMLSWKDADRLMKLMKQAIATMGDLDEIEIERKEMTERFVKGAMSNGWTEEAARETFAGMMKYLFNKGHAAGYGMVSLEEMWYKVYHPLEFWYTKLKYTNQADEAKCAKYAEKAVRSGMLVFLPHVNYSSNYSLRSIEGDKIIQQGLSSLKGVGDKAAYAIEQERKKRGIFRSYDDFYDRCKSRSITTRVIAILKEAGALEFDKDIYLKRVVKYNSALYMRGAS